jgi:hypothetical protein
MGIDRLKSGIWIQAQIRLCTISNLPAYVAKKGDPDAGAIIIRLNKLNGSNLVYSQTRSISGYIAWSPAGNGNPMNDIETSLYLEKQQKYDPDLWILEIEDPNEKFKFDSILLE